MPLSYAAGTLAEHRACRTNAVAFDVSHLGTVRVTGANAFDRLQRALTNDLRKIAPGRTQYTHLLDAGIRLEVVREVFTELRARLGDDLTSAKLVISGSSAMLALDDGELIDLVRKGQGVLNILALGSVQSEVDASISQLRPLAEETGNGAGHLAPATNA